MLTPAEWQVLDWIRHGARRGEVGELRGTGIEAVKYHLANISSKLGMPTPELRNWAGIPSTSVLASRRTTPRMTGDNETLGRIGQVSLKIRDVERAEHFYGDKLGLRHLFTFGDLAFFDAGGVRLYLQRTDESSWHPSSILYFAVDEIHAAQERLSAQEVHFIGAPHIIHTDESTGTEEWMTFFEDGEGNTLALMSQVRVEDASAQGSSVR